MLPSWLLLTETTGGSAARSGPLPVGRVAGRVSGVHSRAFLTELEMSHTKSSSRAEDHLLTVVEPKVKSI